MPTVLTKDEYASLKDDIKEVLPINELKDLMQEFKKLRKICAQNFDKK
jgi:hypothetical protein